MDMWEEKMQLVVKKIYESKCDGQRRGRPKRRWHDMVNDHVRKCGSRMSEAEGSLVDQVVSVGSD